MSLDAIVGTWVVSLLQNGLPKYKYTYTCTASRTVRWYDYWDKTETGVGTWTRSGNQIVFNWKDSATKEYWIPAPTTDGGTATGLVDATYGKFSIVATRTDTVDPSKDLMRQWADNYGDFRSPHICPWAIPYLSMLPTDVQPLQASKVGGQIQKIRGLAIHTTWGNVTRNEEGTVRGTVGEWNKRSDRASAHFAIANNGVLLQIVPTNRIAWAQGGQSDQYYLSVEIETRESAANGAQLQSASILFKWVVDSYGVPKKLATGYIGPHGDGQYAADAKRVYDPITKAMCGADVTTDRKVAVAASGLSCHYWLHPVKPCPGGPLLKQLADIANG
jgi:N-acetylmuramoyl-L-alanine amidase